MKIAFAAAGGFMLGAFAMYAFHGALAAGEESKNKRALSEARNIADALERYRLANGEYPPLDGEASSLSKRLVPQFAKSVWQSDAYSRAYIIFVDASGAAVASLGRNGFVVRGDGRDQSAALAQPTAGAPPDGPDRVSNKVRAPAVVHRVEPDFSRCRGTYKGGPAAEGIVRRDGSITDVQLVRSVDPCVDAALLAAIREWRFRPGTLEGKPVDVRYTVTAYINYR